MLKLQTIICSTRPGRIGPHIAKWFNDFAAAHGDFDARLVDLAEADLPLYNEANHPAMQEYEHEHTKAWASSVNDADAYVFVLPEYNFCPPPSFFNALNYVFHEWNYKPCGFLSYGGVSGGLRSAQVVKQLVTTLKMMPMTEGVTVQMAGSLIDDMQKFQANSSHESSATAMLNEISKWGKALKTIR